MKTHLREYKLAIPLLYAGRVMGQLTVLDIEIKDVDVADEVCTMTADFSESAARTFKAWLRSNTDSKGTMKLSMVSVVRS